MTGEPRSGQVASLFSTTGTSTAATGAAMTRLGTTQQFYITARTSPTDHSFWDPYHIPAFYIGGTPVPAANVLNIYYAAGFVEFKPDTYTTGAVTCDVYWHTPQALGGVYGFNFDSKADTKDVTVFATALNDPVIWRSYIKTLLTWEGSAQRHFFYGRAWALLDCTLAHSDLIWAEKSWGAPGNLRQVEYIVGNDATLQVAYNTGTHKYTVTVGTTGANPTSTATQVKAHVEADPVLNALVSVDYPTGETGTGIVNAKTAVTMTGGRDQAADFDAIGTMVLVRAYLDITTGSLKMVSGLCHLTGLPMSMKLEGLYESDLQLQGIGPLLYHTV